MVLNAHDSQIFEEYYYHWLYLTVAGLLGTLCNIFVIFTTIRAQNKEITNFFKVLLNLQLSSAYALISYTILIIRIQVGNVSYYMGFFTLVFSMDIFSQIICRQLCFTVISMAYLLFVGKFYFHFVPPTSKLQLDKKKRKILVVGSYMVAAVLTLNQLLNGRFIQAPSSEYGQILNDTTNLVLLAMGAIFVSVCVLTHIIYSLATGPVLSERTRKDRIIFIKAFIIVFSIPIFNSTLLSLSNWMFVPHNQQDLKIALNGFSHFHLFLTNLSYLFFIKPIRQSACKILCRAKFEVTQAVRKEPSSVPREVVS